MPEDDRYGDFAWPVEDTDAAEESQRTPHPDTGQEADTPTSATGESATAELPVRRVRQPEPSSRENFDQPTMWLPVRRSPPQRPDQYPVRPANPRAAPRRIEPQATHPSAVSRPSPSPRSEPGDEPTGQPGAGSEASESRAGDAASPAPAPAAPEPAEGEPAEAEGFRSGEPQPEQPEQQEPARSPRRRRRRLLTVAALVFVVALGAVLAVPQVSNRLGLPWAPNAPKAPAPEPVAITRTLHGPGTGQGSGPTAQEVAAALSDELNNPALGKLTGSVVDPATGETLWARGADEPRTPASTTKIVTAAAALLALDHDMRIPTTVVAGREPGTVVLVAGGDPTLSSLPKGENSVYPKAAHLSQLVAEVRQATGGDVQEVVIDLTAYKGPTTAPGWDPVDVPNYTAKAVPAMLDGGRINPKRNHTRRVTNPAGVLLHEFAERLGASVPQDSTVTAPKNTKRLGRVYSAKLVTLVRRCLLLSDNVLANALGRQIAMATGATPSFAGAAKATRKVLARHGFDVSGLHLVDNSGLSELNEIPARLLTDILAVAAAPDNSDPRTTKLRPIVYGLPVAGGTGTLAARYDSPATEAGSGWVRAKTGTLTAVNALAGVVLTSEGSVLVFAFMSSGTPSTVARPALDALAAALR